MAPNVTLSKGTTAALVHLHAAFATVVDVTLLDGDICPVVDNASILAIPSDVASTDRRPPPLVHLTTIATIAVDMVGVQLAHTAVRHKHAATQVITNSVAL